MPDIFVSYSRKDRDRVRDIVERLEEHGWSVWWDPDIIPGERYANTIDEQLRAAKCVLAVWSESSAASDWVQEEAEDGKTRGLLVPVLIDDIPIPRGFRRIQTVDLSDWRGNVKDPAWAYVIAAVKRFVEGGPAPSIMPPKTRRQKRHAFFANTIGIALLVLIAGGVWWGATHPAQAVAITQNTFIANIINIFTGGGASQGASPDGAAKVRSAGGEREPNDTADQAIALALNRSIAGEISSEEDVDFYRIEAGPGPRNRLTLRMESVGETLRPQMRVLDSNRSEIMNAYDTTLGADIERVILAKPGERFFIAAKQFSSSTGGYRLSVANDTRHSAAASVSGAAQEREPNDAGLNAFEIAWGRPLLGHLHRDGDEDYFRVIAPGNVAEAQVRVRAFSQDMRPQVTIYDENREQIGEEYTTTLGADIRASFAPQAGAAYYFRVKSFSSGEGDYVLEVGR